MARIAYKFNGEISRRDITWFKFMIILLVYKDLLRGDLDTLLCLNKLA